jgi:purine-cytosine permease-like protein
VAEGNRVDDRAVPGRVFLAVGALVTVIAVVYGLTSDEEAGNVLLALSAVLALWSAAYLWLQLRRQRRMADGEQLEPEAPEYLPHASVWPFAIGLGATTAVNGLVLGTWVLVPGLALTVLGIGGFIRQSRLRD